LTFAALFRLPANSKHDRAGRAQTTNKDLPMKKMISLSFFLSVMLMASNTTLAQTPAPNAETKAAGAKIAQMLEASGQTYIKAGEGVWVVKYKGNQMSEIAVLTIYSEGMLILASKVAEKTEFKPTPELMQKLLTLNDTLDRVKVGIDAEDGEIFLRIDLSMRVVDQQELNANLEQISAATDETYAAIKTYLLAPKKAVK
jgi:Putative bacterial sensory transduction regulator